jgi:phospholipase/carboxylesterase
METPSLIPRRPPLGPHATPGSSPPAGPGAGAGPGAHATAPPGAGALLALATLASTLGCRRIAAPPVDAAAAGEDPILPVATWVGLTVRTAGERHHPSQVVILLHGWGASGSDLVPLAAELAAPGRLFVFPEAPLAGAWGGRAWWHLDMVALEAARAGGRDRDLRATIPDGLPEARARILALLDEIERRTHLPPSALVLGGFSQGAMLAVDAGLAADPHPAALVALSGTLVSESTWTAALATARPPIPVFLSHGRLDPVLPFRLAEALHALISTSGHPVTWVPFQGGHEIPGDVLVELAAFLPRP